MSGSIGSTGSVALAGGAAGGVASTANGAPTISVQGGQSTGSTGTTQGADATTTSATGGSGTSVTPAGGAAAPAASATSKATSFLSSPLLGGIIAFAGAGLLAHGLHVNAAALESDAKKGEELVGKLDKGLLHSIAPNRLAAAGLMGTLTGAGVATYGAYTAHAQTITIQKQATAAVTNAVAAQQTSDQTAVVNNMPELIQSYAQQDPQDFATLASQLGAGTTAANGAAAGGPTDTTTGGTTGTDPAADATGTTDPTATDANANPTATDSSGAAQNTGTAIVGSASSNQTQGAAIPDASWTPQAVVNGNYSVTLAGQTSGTNPVAGGPFKINSVVGNADGYSTLAEADSAASGAVWEADSTQDMRWVVLQHGAKFYAFSATSDTAKSGALLPAASGDPVAFHELQYNVNNSTAMGEWDATSWSKAGGFQTAPWTGGAAGSGAAGASTAADGAASTPTVVTAAEATPTAGAGAGASVIAGGPASTAAASPVAGAIGTTFSIATVPGAAGGNLQIQSEVGSGFADPTSAAQAAAAARSAGVSDKWQRWVVVQAPDSTYHVMQGSIVAQPTVALDASIRPQYVFGAGFGEFFNGATWTAQAA